MQRSLPRTMPRLREMKLHPLAGILFDLDGVLVESYEVWFHLLNATAREWNFAAITREQFQASWGQGVQADIEKFFPGRTVSELEEYYQRHFRDHAAHMIRNPDGPNLFGRLKESRIKIAVITNTPSPLAGEILALAGLSPDTLVGGTDVPRAKPAPDMVFRACERLQIDPSSAIVVGDSRYDKEAAAAAEVRFVGLGIEGDVTLRRLSELEDFLSS